MVATAKGLRGKLILERF